MTTAIRRRASVAPFIHLLCLTVVTGCPIMAAHAVAPPTGELDEVVVTATLRNESDLRLAASASVLLSQDLHAGGEEHLEDVLGLIPNLNFAAGTNRARYFQLRGIGELDQYEGAPNPSVGLLVDDIDFSGLGSMATLFDVDRMEVLRGPQGTRYGANALAGLMVLQSAAPNEAFGGRLEAGFGDYGSRRVGAVLTGPVEGLDSSFRLAGERFTSNGYVRNDYLNRNDTNGRDESTLRGRWRWHASSAVTVDLSVLHVGIHDGYDAFSPENGRVTHSDKPGVDEQDSTGASAKVTWLAQNGRTLSVIASGADSQIRYGYDGDWGNPAYWNPYVYDFTELQHRHRTTQSAEVRYASADAAAVRWLVGAYTLDLRERLNDVNLGISIDPVNGEYDLNTVLESAYHSRSTSVFGLFDGDVGGQTHWTVGLRGEHRQSDYSDVLTDFAYGANDAHRFAPAENLFGGHAGLTHDLDAHRSVYLQLSRGYKAGGFNLSSGLLPSEITFRPEADWNFETGYKQRGARLDVDADVFAVSRQNAQLRSSIQTDPNNPNSFIFYTGNAASGFDYGVESTVRAHLTDHWTAGATLGLLQTRFHNFVRVGDSGTTSVSRELPHAPHASGHTYLEYRAGNGFTARADLEVMGGFYYDLPPNDTHSGSYALGHLRFGWDTPRYSLMAYVRNLTDHTYVTRGFYFGLEPPDYPNKLYVQLGEPRVVGIDLKFRFGSLGDGR